MDSKLSGGWSTTRAKYSEGARMAFKVLVSERREIMSHIKSMPLNRSGERPEGEMLRGSRFHSDEAILARVESMCSEEMFRTHAAEAIDAALIDAAKSDYWYEFEKCYDTHEAEDEHEDDGIEDGRD